MTTLSDHLRFSAAVHPDKPAMTFKGVTTTYEQMDQRVDALAAELIQRGLSKGDRVVLMAANSDHFGIGIFAALRAGAIVAPVNPKSAGPEIEHFVTDSGAKMLMFGPEVADQMAEWQRDYPETANATQLFSLGASEVGEDIFAAVDAKADGVPEQVEIGLSQEDDALIIYTSGTTGQPKGALFDHYRIVWVGVGILSILRPCQFDNIMQVAPMYHSAALNLLFFPGIMQTAHHVILEDFHPEVVLDTFEEHEINVFFGVPTMFIYLLRSPSLPDRDLSKLRVSFFGAAPMPKSVAEQVVQAFPHTEFLQLAGLTEGGPGGVLLTFDEVKANPAASGRSPITGTEVRVVDAEGNGVAVGEVGEMILRGRTIMKEYWGRPTETAATLVDGWLRTGDLTHVGEDGYLTIVDRLKDMIITGGRNVYSAEVENALVGYPEIADIAIVSKPHEEFGESIVAVVTTDGGNPTLEGLQEYAKSRLSHYKVPHEMIIDEIPRNPSGKIQKHRLRKQLV